MAEKANNSHPSKRDNAWWNNRFYTVLISVALIGGGCAFFIPLFITSYGPGDNVPGLRQAFLAITGGTLAILTLWETRRKNDQEHMRQVHAERRSRYATAIEQLADDKSAIRLGGVYTLAKLVDDWLDDEKTLPSMEKRRQEGQIIIDSLCAYIRSSFPLAERHDELTLSYEEYQQKYQDKNQVTQSVENSADNSMPKAKHQDNKQSSQSREEFVRDKSLFQEEQEVRKTVLSEIKNRLNGGKTKNKDGRYEIKAGTWSSFNYDFSNTAFFYPVNLSGSHFGASSNFSGTTFTQDAEFSGATFTQKAYFLKAKFTQNVYFSEAEFTQNVYFSEAEFTQKAYFSGATFTQKAYFLKAKFTQKAYFSKAKFTQNAYFSRATFTQAYFSGATFTQDASFSGVEFTQAYFAGATFTRADFAGAKFTRNASFSGVEFTGKAYLSGAKFTRADFSGATFTQDAYFFGATFTGSANFSKAIFEHNPIFGETEGFNLSSPAKFSCETNPEDYKFKVSPGSPYKIETKEQEHNGVKFIIPEDAMLFDPDNPFAWAGPAQATKSTLNNAFGTGVWALNNTFGTGVWADNWVSANTRWYRSGS